MLHAFTVNFMPFIKNKIYLQFTIAQLNCRCAIYKLTVHSTIHSLRNNCANCEFTNCAVQFINCANSQFAPSIHFWATAISTQYRAFMKLGISIFQKKDKSHPSGMSLEASQIIQLGLLITTLYQRYHTCRSLPTLP